MSHARTTLARACEPKPIGEDIMNDATKRAGTGALAHMLSHVMAVTALLVIAVCVFYVR